VAGFYSARSRTIPPLPWPTFAPPLSSGLDQAPAMTEAVKPAPPHGNIRGKNYYQ
jgi:hypothetical protein